MELTLEQSTNLIAIVSKLTALNIKINFKRCEPGPIVTSYYFSLDACVSIKAIMNKEEDIALGVGVPSVLITRSHGEICIAIPNKARSIVSFDNCLHHVMLQKDKMRLPLMIGVDTKGQYEVQDLIKSPHVLIAGSTGAGKSVFLASLISGLVTARTPKELRLVLIDTKQLDLPLFKSLPHVTDVADNIPAVHKSFDILNNIVRKRMEKMKGLARNVDEYNRLGIEQLPYYVVVIDELADIFAQDKSMAMTDENIKKKERLPVRLQSLAQICRAAGVHLIVATQRPSVKVISGDIKANLATRIALRLPSQHDSKTVLNSTGAESLLGKGDMLIESPNTEELLRFHGPYVDMNHIGYILEHASGIREAYKMLV